MAKKPFPYRPVCWCGVKLFSAQNGELIHIAAWSHLFVKTEKE